MHAAGKADPGRLRRPRLHRRQAARGDRGGGGYPLTLLIKSGGAAAFAEWQAHFAEAAPGLRVHAWDDPALDAAVVHYAMVWDPGPRLAALPNLRLVISAGVGVDHITQTPGWPADLPLVRMGGPEPAQRMGEYVCLACLGLLRDLRRIAAADAAGRWDNFEVPRCAPDVTVGIMGLGTMGARAAAMLAGLGFTVAGWSRSAKALPGVACYAGRDGRDAFLARSDILVCLLPDTPETRGAVRAETLALLPPGAAVVNAARGGHVVLPDLIAALDTGRLSAAVLDVFDHEPLPASDPAWAHPRITVTSHLASIASRRSRAQFVAEVIRTFEAGEALPNLYDVALGY